MDTGKKFRVWKLGGGVFWNRSDLDTGKKFRVWKFGGGRDGGVLESQNPKCQDLAKFPFLEGGCSGTKFQNRGVLSNLVKKFWKPSLPVHHR